MPCCAQDDDEFCSCSNCKRNPKSGSGLSKAITASSLARSFGSTDANLPEAQGDCSVNPFQIPDYGQAQEFLITGRQDPGYKDSTTTFYQDARPDRGPPTSKSADSGHKVQGTSITPPPTDPLHNPLQSSSAIFT